MALFFEPFYTVKLYGRSNIGKVSTQLKSYSHKKMIASTNPGSSTNYLINKHSQHGPIQMQVYFEVIIDTNYRDSQMWVISNNSLSSIFTPLQN